MLHIYILKPTNTTSYQLMDFHENIRESHNFLIQTCLPHICVVKQRVTEFYRFFPSLQQCLIPLCIFFFES